MPTADSISPLRINAAAGRIRRLLNDGMLAFLTGVGDRSGLLPALCEGAPATADAIARATALPPAVVSSWLAAMVAGRIVEYDGGRATYALPAETAAFLAGAEGRAVRARLTQLCTLGDTLRAAPKGPTTETTVTPAAVTPAADQPRLEDLVRLVPGLGARLRAGVQVLELACGAGWLTCAVAAAHPASRCTGRDPSGERIRAARRRARAQGLGNAHFVRGGALPARSTTPFDVVVSLDECVWASAAAPARLARMMAPGAYALLAVPATTGSPADDALHPFGPYLLGARALSPAPVAPPGAELGRRLAAAGFRVSALARLPDDAFRNFLIIEKPIQPNTSTPDAGDRS